MNFSFFCCSSTGTITSIEEDSFLNEYCLGDGLIGSNLFNLLDWDEKSRVKLRFLQQNDQIDSFKETLTFKYNTSHLDTVLYFKRNPSSNDYNFYNGMASLVSEKEGESGLDHIIGETFKNFLLNKDYDSAVDEALKSVGEYCKASRSYLFRLNDTQLINTHEWCAPGVSSEIHSMQNLSAETFSWWMEQLEKGSFIAIDDISRLPEDAFAEREIFKSQKISSVLSLPIIINESLLGFVGFDNPFIENNLPEYKKTLLGILSQIFSIAIDRQNMLSELGKRNLELKQALEIAKMGSWEYDISNKQFTLSEESMEIYGIRNEHIPEDMFLSKVHPEDKKHVTSSFLKLFENLDPQQETYRIISEDNSEKWICSNGITLRNAKNEPVKIIGVSQEVTEFMNTQINLEASRKKYQDFLRISAEGIYRGEFIEPMDVNLPEDEQVKWALDNVMLTECNSVYAKMYGYDKPESMIGLKFREIVDTKTAEEIAKAFVAYRYTFVNLETNEVNSSGKKIDFLNNLGSIIEDDKVINFWGTSIDITELKNAEKMLKTSQEMFQQMADSIKEVFFLYDAEPNTFLYVSPAAEEVIGLTTEELMKNSSCLKDIVDTDSHVELKSVFGGGKINVELRLKSDSKEMEKWIQVRVFPLKESESTNRCIAGVISDISVHKDGLKKERLHLEQIQQADKMASLGVLVSGIAHEINNPNNFIMLNSPLIEEVWNDAKPILDEYFENHRNLELANTPYSDIAETIPKLFRSIVNGSERIKSIVEELKSYSRKEESYVSTDVNIIDVIDGAVSLLRSQIKKSTNHFKIEYPKYHLIVKGNKQKLEQVMINLIQNSCLALESNEKSINVVIEKRDGACIIEVKDEGCGIKKEHLSQIKDPFFTTRRNTGGTGLGLSVSERIIHEHEGTLDYYSVPGEGTVATIMLKLA